MIKRGDAVTEKANVPVDDMDWSLSIAQFRKQYLVREAPTCFDCAHYYRSADECRHRYLEEPMESKTINCCKVFRRHLSYESTYGEPKSKSMKKPKGTGDVIRD